MFKLFIIYSLF